MADSPRQELWVGAFVLVGLVAIAYLSFAIGGLQGGGPGGLEIQATFDEIGGLKSRARVVIGGVKVGQVKGIGLADDFRARVTLDVDAKLALPSDTSASILTSGVLGDQYIALEPGAEETKLAPGDELQFTQSAIVLERLIGKLIQNLGSGSKGTDAGAAPAAESGTPAAQPSGGTSE